MTTSESFETEALAAVKDWFADTSRSVYVIGPLIPVTQESKALTGEKKMSEKANEIDTFMEAVLASHGRNSMLYVWDLPSFSFVY